MNCGVKLVKHFEILNWKTYLVKRGRLGGISDMPLIPFWG
jgi:hypothetical protein